MNRKISVSVALAITIIAMTLTFSITWIVSMRVFDDTVSAVTRLQAQYSKLAEIDNYVRGNFNGEIDDDHLFDRVAMGYMSGLGDRYCTYYTEAEYAELLAIENGRLVGVGIEAVRDPDGTYRIARVYNDSPAARAGVQMGARIMQVGGVEAKDFSGIAELRRAFYGGEGTELALVTLFGVADEQTFNIQRTHGYTPPTVESVIVNGYAYIRISAFTAKTYTEFDYAVNQAKGEGVLGYVFDVRGNTGGYFRNSYEMIDLVCPLGTIAKSVNKAGTVQVLYTSDEEGLEAPMVVLVNEGTSAAAELFAVSVRDLAGGQVVGTRTVGRTAIQSSPYRLADGSAIVVTRARLITGRDESFDGGIIPDVVIEGDAVEESMLLMPDPNNDPQIRRAIEVARLMVRDAGGNPDAIPTPDDPNSTQSAPDATEPPVPASSSEEGGDTGGDDTGGDNADTTGDEDA